MARLFVELLKDSLNEYAYNAEIAGVDYKIENTMYGICVSIEKSALVSGTTNRDLFFGQIRWLLEETLKRCELCRTC